MFLALVFGFIAGALSVFAINVLVIYYWLKLKPKEDPKLVPKHTNVCNPKHVADYCRAEGATSSESCVFLNLMFAFLWREWRDTTKTKSFFIKKMNLEFQELLLNKAAGKLLQQIRVKDFYLGDSLPVIKQATVMKIQSRDADQVAQELDVALDIEYSGGFLISLDAELIFGKTAYMAVKLNSLKGRLRLQFTRNPCTHWSFSFYEDPEMDIEVESQFNGKNLAKLTTLIENQIKRSIRRKHTLPRYKVRYKPFFQQPISHDGKKEVFVHNGQVTVGKLDVEVLECTRLPVLPINSQLYCNISVDTLAWNEFMPKNSLLWPVHEVSLTKTLSGSVGVSIKQSMGSEAEGNREMIIIDAISPHSPASTLDIQRGDVLLAINDIDVESMKQAVRLIKNSGEKLAFKLQRPPPCVPVINVENNEASDGESKDEEMNDSSETQKNDYESSFNFDNVTIDTDDSDGEEFVNIVVQELEQEIAKNDEKARTILRKVSLSTKIDKPARTSSVNFKDQEKENSMEKEADKSSKKSSSPKTEKVQKKLNDKVDENCRKDSISSVRNNENKENIDSKRDKRIQSIKKNGVVQEKENPVDNETSCDSEAQKKHSDRLSLSRKILHNKDQSIDFDSDTSDSISEASNRTDADGGWDNISQHTLLNRDANQTSQKTSLVCSSVDPSWNESFCFDIEKQHKFLNVCVWSKCEEREGKDVLLGYASISLMEIALECLSTTSHKHVQSYFLTPSYYRSGVSRTNLRVLMPGLKPETCNGDITLTFCYKPSLQNCFFTGEELNQALDGYVNKSEEIREDQDSCGCGDKLLNTEKRHDFMGTQFHYATRCDYCQKKVWTKAAFQCRVCAMICHKKCITNAHSNTYCTRMGVRAKPPSWRSEDDASKKPNGIVNKEPLERKDVDSVSLNIPNIDDSRQSLRTKSMSSPQLLRRRVIRHAVAQDSDGIEHPLQRSCDSKGVDSIAAAAETAKKAGKELYTSLEEDSRQEKLEKMVQKMQCEMDDENQKRTELCAMEKQISDKEKRTKLQTSMRKSEERSQALSLLMIQYRSALKECRNKTNDQASE